MRPPAVSRLGTDAIIRYSAGMSHVTGIGGFFFRARDPKALAAWYATHLGIPDGCKDFWSQQAGPTAMSAFRQTSDYFPADRSAMLNLRVQDLAGLSEKLETAGIEVLRNPDWDCELGLFARIHDPEGNPIELWEPSEAATD